MGKKTAEGSVAGEAHSTEAQPDSKKRQKRESKAAPSRKSLKLSEKPKKSGNTKTKNEVAKASERSKSTASEVSNRTKVSKTLAPSSSSSSDSESEKNSNRNDKKSVSDSNSDSESDSSDSDSSTVSKSEKSTTKKLAEVVKEAKNSVVNLSPVKSYDPPPKSSSSDSYHSDTEEEDKKRRKKQKKLFKIQLNKQAKRGNTPKREIKPEMYIDVDIKEEDMEYDGMDNIHPSLVAVPDWPEADYNELLRRMEALIPPKDNQKFDSRAARLDWSKVAFGEYNPDECYDVWLRISKRIRRFRTLSEMITDAKDWVTKPWTNFYRGPKKNRHPDMPTRPLSVYMLYYLEQKDKVVRDNPGLEMTQEYFSGVSLEEIILGDASLKSELTRLKEIHAWSC